MEAARAKAVRWTTEERYSSSSISVCTTKPHHAVSLCARFRHTQREISLKTVGIADSKDKKGIETHSDNDIPDTACLLQLVLDDGSSGGKNLFPDFGRGIVDTLVVPRSSCLEERASTIPAAKVYVHQCMYVWSIR